MTYMHIGNLMKELHQPYKKLGEKIIGGLLYIYMLSP